MARRSTTPWSTSRTGAKTPSKSSTSSASTRENSHQRYDVILLINGVPVVQIELKTLGDQPAPCHAADRRLQERPRQRLHQDAAVLHAAFHRQQPQRYLVFRQQQQPPFQLQCRRALSSRSISSPPRTTRRSPTSTASPRAFLPKCTLGADDQPLHGAGRQRAKADDDAALPDLCSQGHRGLHPPELRQRLHLAHHRQRQDAHLLQGIDPAQGQPGHRKMPVRRGPQGPGPADAGGVQPIPGRLRRGKYQHRAPWCGVYSPTTTPTR